MGMFDQFKPSRRGFMGAVGGAVGAGAGLLATRGAIAAQQTTGFTHNVASGDPLADRVIIWSRFRPEDGSKNVMVDWEVALDQSFETVVARGKGKTGPASDYTLKIDVTGLAPNQRYFYRFTADGKTSPIGRTKTLANSGISEAKLGVVSCSNFPQGFFNVYKELASRELDVVLHLGDYIYEYAEGIYSNEDAVAMGRGVKPKHEIVSIDDYRTRYALYRSDPDLQAAHANHPFICVWDDHEISNDTWKNGAQNHNEDEGSFEARKNAAVQAYHEWLPIREGQQGKTKINRTFELGTLARLIMLDTRLIGRDEQLSYEKDLPMRSIPFNFSDPKAPVAVLDPSALAALPGEAVKFIPVPFDLRGEKPVPMTDFAEIQKLDPQNLPAGFSYLPDTDTFKKDILGAEDRQLLGQEQEEWLDGELKAASEDNIPWQILGQQLLIGRVGIPQLKDEDIDFEKSKFISKERLDGLRMLGRMGLPLNMDAWDGYPAARDRVFRLIQKNESNAVFLAGDTHNAWSFDLVDSEGTPAGVEFGTPSVSSPGFESYIPAAPGRVEEEIMKASPELKFFNSKDRGWIELTITEETVQSDWYFVTSVLSKDYDVVKGPGRKVAKGAKATTPA